jgi:putative solute:sodium symporter small subunit
MHFASMVADGVWFSSAPALSIHEYGVAPRGEESMEQGKVNRATLTAYWAENKRLTTITLVIWALVSFGAIFAVEGLNSIVILGFPLGYYMGAQGSLVVFVALIFNYSSMMNKIDKKYDLQEEEE